MIFLIEYDRLAGRTETFKSFAELDRTTAERERLGIELDLNRRGVVGHEVVLLDAASEEALLRTHRRYFEDLEQIVRSSDAGR